MKKAEVTSSIGCDVTCTPVMKIAPVRDWYVQMTRQPVEADERTVEMWVMLDRHAQLIEVGQNVYGAPIELRLPFKAEVKWLIDYPIDASLPHNCNVVRQEALDSIQEALSNSRRPLDFLLSDRVGRCLSFRFNLPAAILKAKASADPSLDLHERLCHHFLPA